MVIYGLIPKVRKLAGISAVFEHSLKMGLGDGIKTVFQVPSVGNRNYFFVDKDAGVSSTITEDVDIIAYVDSVAIPITSFDIDSGKITLSSAPALNTTITVDYVFSEISDDDVIEAMGVAEAQTDFYIRGKNELVSNYIQANDGDGKTTVFTFDHADVITINLVTIDGVTKILNTDYWLYKYKGDSTKYWYIRFKTPPSWKQQSIIIDYDHGEIQVGVTRLAEYLAARYILLEIKPSRASGMWIKGEKGTEKSDVSRLQIINMEIKNLKYQYDRRIIYEST